MRQNPNCCNELGSTHSATALSSLDKKPALKRTAGPNSNKRHNVNPLHSQKPRPARQLKRVKSVTRAQKVNSKRQHFRMWDTDINCCWKPARTVQPVQVAARHKLKRSTAVNNAHAQALPRAALLFFASLGLVRLVCGSCPWNTCSYRSCPEGCHYYHDYHGDHCGACALGKYKPGCTDSTTTACTNCPAGQYTALTGQSACLECLPGQYNPSQGQSFCADCDVGKHSKDPGMSSCTSCEKGKYGAIEGLFVCTDCEAGKYGSEAGAVSDTACLSCAAGRYNSVPGEAEVDGVACTACPAGRYNQQVGSRTAESCVGCLAGFYSVDIASTSNSSCKICQAGHFIGLVGSSHCDKCEAGRYNPHQGSVDRAECLPCVPGEYCEAGATLPAPCTAGRYCDFSFRSVECPAGYFCPEHASAPVQCTDGRYCPKGSIKSTEPCPAGFSCASPAVKTVCQPGTFCPTGTVLPIPCAAGTYADDVGRSSACTAQCPAGSACPAGSSEPMRCSQTEYCPAGSGKAELCPPGYFCQNPSTHKACPAGSYCAAGTVTPTACPQMGSLCPEGSANATMMCPQGSFCPTPASRNDCPAGSYCVAGVTVAAPCEAGQYCPQRSYEQQPCPAGSVCTTPASKVACKLGSYCPESSTLEANCPAGKYCPTPTQQEECPVGYFCPARSSAARANACTVSGTYCPAGSAIETVPCPPRMYCPNPGTAIHCSRIQYCPPGTIEPHHFPDEARSPVAAFIFGGLVLFVTVLVLFWLQLGGYEWLSRHEEARKRAQYALTMYGLVYLFVSLITDAVAYTGLKGQLCKNAPPIKPDASREEFIAWSAHWDHCPLTCGDTTCTTGENTAFASLINTPLTILLVVTWIKEVAKCGLFVMWLTNGHHESKRLQYVLRNLLALPAACLFGRTAFLRQYYAPGAVDQVKFQAVDALLQQVPQTILMIAITVAKGVLPSPWTAFSLLLALTGTVMAISPIFSRVNAHVKEARSNVLEFVKHSEASTASTDGATAAAPAATPAAGPSGADSTKAAAAPRRMEVRNPLAQAAATADVENDCQEDDVPEDPGSQAQPKAAEVSMRAMVTDSKAVSPTVQAVASVETWDAAAVAAHLREAGLANAADVLEKNGVDGACLEHIDHEVLQEVGLDKKLERVRVLQVLQKLVRAASRRSAFGGVGAVAPHRSQK